MSLKNFVKSHGLTSPNIIDLSFVGGGGRYYTSIQDAVADANSGSPSHALSTNNAAVCEVFFGNDVIVVRLLADCEIANSIVTSAPMIIDLNNCTVSLSTSSTSKSVFSVNSSCVFYGRNNNLSKISNISSTRATVMGIDVTWSEDSYLAIINCSVYAEGHNSATCCVQYVSKYADFINSKFELYGSASKMIGFNHRATSVAMYTTAIYNRCVVRSTSTKTSYQSGDSWLAMNFGGGKISIIDSNFMSEARNSLNEPDSANGILLADRFGSTVAYIRNSIITSASRGASIQCNCYSENNHFSSRSHGGVYVSKGYTFIDHDSTFEKIGNDISSANGCSYISGGSSAYFDGSTFLCDNTPSPLAITSIYYDGGIVYVSNSTIPCVRVDGVTGSYSESKLYIGENVIIQTPSSNTVSGTMVHTEDNYRAPFPKHNPSAEELFDSLNSIKMALLDMAKERTMSELPLNENSMMETIVSALKN